jgi:hypothetical protein
MLDGAPLATEATAAPRRITRRSRTMAHRMAKVRRRTLRVGAEVAGAVVLFAELEHNPARHAANGETLVCCGDRL